MFPFLPASNVSTECELTVSNQHGNHVGCLPEIVAVKQWRYFSGDPHNFSHANLEIHENRLRFMHITAKWPLNDKGLGRNAYAIAGMRIKASEKAFALERLSEPPLALRSLEMACEPSTPSSFSGLDPAELIR